MPQEFLLQEGEAIIQDIKPLKNLLYMWIVVGIIPMYFLAMFLGWFILLPFAFFFALILVPLTALLGEAAGGLVSLILTIVGIVIAVLIPLVFTVVVSYLRFKKQHYWITNKRVMLKSGLIGYKINSVPLERISDVVVSRSFIEQIFGIASVHVQSLAGQLTPGQFGAELNIEAVQNPEELQKLIFELVKAKRKTEGLTM
jgi:uncharacterized membrane protein YdbT with pleckstrin-like domain